MTDQLTITITGPQGSGKTGLVDFLNRVFSARGGKVRVPSDLPVAIVMDSDGVAPMDYILIAAGPDANPDTVASIQAIIDAENGRRGHKEGRPSARVTMSPHSVQDGDRVRLTLEGVVGAGPGNWDGMTKNLAEKLAAKFGDALTIELLERPERPLAVGDAVLGPYTPEGGVIRHIAQGIAAVEFPSDFRTIAFDDLCRPNP